MWLSRFFPVIVFFVTLLDGVKSSPLLTERAPPGCTARDIEIVRRTVSDELYFCKWYLSDGRTRSPFLEFTPTEVINLCNCIIVDTKTVPKQKRAEATTVKNLLEKRQTQASCRAEVSRQFTEPSSFCTFYNSYPRTTSPFAKYSAQALIDLCKCVEGKVVASSGKKTTSSTRKTSASTKRASSSSKKVSSSAKNTISSNGKTTTSSKKASESTLKASSSSKIPSSSIKKASTSNKNFSSTKGVLPTTKKSSTITKKSSTISEKGAMTTKKSSSPTIRSHLDFNRVIIEAFVLSVVNENPVFFQDNVDKGSNFFQVNVKDGSNFFQVNVKDGSNFFQVNVKDDSNFFQVNAKDVDQVFNALIKNASWWGLQIFSKCAHI
ncbi:hypothetical protein E4T39_07082 [Aureobasidium subglaciale]|nr:hypothetical protein E4T39_07082 [Aureobasidium subglaciale]